MNVAFRNFWFYCILLGFRNGKWYNNWHTILSKIARYTPTLLVSGSNANSLETILESNSILRQKFSDGVTRYFNYIYIHIYKFYYLINFLFYFIY